MAVSRSDAEPGIHRHITAAIAVGTALGPLLAQITRAAARLCDADMAAIALLTDKGDELEMVGVHGIRPAILGTRLPLKLSFDGRAITAGRAVRSTDVLRDPPPMVRILPPLTGARGALAVPLRGSIGPFGALSVAKCVCWRFRAHNEAVLTQLADSASIAIQNAQLRGAGFHSTEAAAAVTRAILRAPSTLPSVTEDRSPTPTAGCHLSPREREIITLVAGGQTFKEIASSLGISDRTVEHYLERLKQRFHQPRLAALVGHVLTHGVGLLRQ